MAEYELADSAPAGVPAPDENRLRTPDEIMAEQTRAANSTEGLLGSAAAAAQGALSNIPGAKYAIAKLASVLGVPEQEAARIQEQLSEEHPGAELTGTVGGAIASGGALGGAKAVTGAATLGGKVLAGAGAIAKSAAVAGAMEPAYKLGDIASNAQLHGDALHAEQISHAFDIDDVLSAAAWGGAIGAGGTALSGAAGVGKTLAGKAATGAGKFFQGAAKDLEMSPAEVGRIALDHGLLNKAGKASEYVERSAIKMADAAKEVEVLPDFRENAAFKLQSLADHATLTSSAKKPARIIADHADRLARSELDGPQVQEIIDDLGAKAKATSNPSHAQLLGDAKASLQDSFAEQLHLQDPELGSRYRGAANDHRTFSAMAGEAAKALESQATMTDLAKAGARSAVARTAAAAVDSVLPGTGHLTAGMLDYTGLSSLSKLGRKNYSNLLNKVANKLPSEAWSNKVDSAVKSLLVPNAAIVANLTAKNLDDDYSAMAQKLHTVATDPVGAATKLRSQLDFLPPATADQVATGTMAKLQAAQQELPTEYGPATAFGTVPGTSDRQKREFLRKTGAKFDPFGAIASGRSDLIAEAEKYHPETVNAVRARVMHHITTNPNVSYLTKRRVLGILGVPGVPTQDPTVGGHLQQIIQAKKQAQDSQGQMKSARQANATLKNNSATLTRAQSILNEGE